MTLIEKTHEQLLKDFKVDIERLKKSAKRYDEGEFSESNTLAELICKLIGDRTGRRNTISLATRLNIKPDEMIDTAIGGWQSQEYHGPICALGYKLANHSGLLPALDGIREPDDFVFAKTSFEEWWNAPVLRDCLGNLFSRQFLVETFRDKEAVHTDLQLPAKYGDLVYNNSFAVHNVPLLGKQLDENVVWVIVRQVAHEILRTFDPNMPLQYLPTTGNNVQPWVLARFILRHPDGMEDIIPNSEQVPILFASTSNPELWKKWSENGAHFKLPSQAPRQLRIGHAEGTQILVQHVALNYTPEPYLLNLPHLRIDEAAFPGVQILLYEGEKRVSYRPSSYGYIYSKPVFAGKTQKLRP